MKDDLRKLKELKYPGTMYNFVNSIRIKQCHRTVKMTDSILRTLLHVQNFSFSWLSHYTFHFVNGFVVDRTIIAWSLHLSVMLPNWFGFVRDYMCCIVSTSMLSLHLLIAFYMHSHSQSIFNTTILLVAYRTIW